MRFGSRAGRPYVRQDLLSSPPQASTGVRRAPLGSQKRALARWLAPLTAPPCARAATNLSVCWRASPDPRGGHPRSLLPRPSGTSEHRQRRCRSRQHTTSSYARRSGAPPGPPGRAERRISHVNCPRRRQRRVTRRGRWRLMPHWAGLANDRQRGKTERRYAPAPRGIGARQRGLAGRASFFRPRQCSLPVTATANPA